MTDNRGHVFGPPSDDDGIAAVAGSFSGLHMDRGIDGITRRAHALSVRDLPAGVRRVCVNPADAFVAASLAPEDQNRYFERTVATPVRHDRPEPLPPPWWRASAPPLPRISAMDMLLPKPHGSNDFVYSRHFVGFIHSGRRDRPSSEKCIRKTRPCQDVALEAGAAGQQTRTCVA
jgi:hypothetical protein